MKGCWTPVAMIWLVPRRVGCRLFEQLHRSVADGSTLTGVFDVAAIPR
jgi:hypothetical protein